MPIAETILGSLVGKVTEKVGDALDGIRREARADKVAINDGYARSFLIKHVEYIQSWASSITLLTLIRDKNLKESFVELSLDVGLTRNTSRADSSQKVSIGDLFESPRHAVILGQPGAGKTTSLQRIAQLALAGWEKGGNGPPLLVRLRDLQGDDSLVTYLLGMLGIDVKTPQRMSGALRRAWEQRAIGEYLSTISAILLVDGLDETPYSLRARVEAELREFVLNLGGHRIFLTCRTAEYTAPLPKVQPYTILPLSTKQVTEFANRWLGKKAPSFIKAVARNPYAGSEVVPLTLAHLCAIYERDGELPPRPIDVYEQIVSLLVEEWDKQRQVFRVSRYSDFSWRKKERFLQAAAYGLAMNGRKGSFRDADLEDVYEEIAPEFNLPLDDARHVIKEIESHTGLIHEVGNGRFEFVHLVIQEYLSAMYAHRKVNAVKQLTPGFPNEMALVIAYSTGPEEYLEEALLDGLDHGTAAFIVPFLARLGIEKPIWRASPLLGWIVLGFLDELSLYFRSVDQSHTLRLPPEALVLLEDPAIAESVSYALSEADVLPETFAFRVIPRPHASLPDALTKLLRARPGAAGLALLNSERRIQRLLQKKRKRDISHKRRRRI